MGFAFSKEALYYFIEFSGFSNHPWAKCNASNFLPAVHSCWHLVKFCMLEPPGLPLAARGFAVLEAELTNQLSLQGRDSAF